MDALYDAQWCRIFLECGAVYLAVFFLVSFLWEGFKRWWKR